MTQLDLHDYHWMMDILQAIDAGLVVIDRQYTVQVWNSFMGNHSNYTSDEVIGKNLFSLFNEIPKEWFLHKLESVFLLKNRRFTTWEHRPYLFHFKSYRPITGSEDIMYQNITIYPLLSQNHEVNHLCIIVYDATEIAVHKKNMLAANAQLATLSRVDPLTGIYNRGYWEHRLEQEFNRYQRTQTPATLVMFDIDHFKMVNDTYGHPAGDTVIRQTADMLKANMRDVDICGRYGGEEYAVILVNADGKGGEVFAERLRKVIASSPVYFGNHEHHFTISLGVCELNAVIRDPQQWVECADQALYQSKKLGRDRTTIYTDSDESL